MLARYHLKDILNADEFSLLYETLPSKSSHFRGKRCSCGKRSKVQSTGMAASNALGKQIPIFLIGKSASLRCFKLVRKLSCRYQSQKTVWMDGALFEEWLHELDRKFEMQERKVVMIVGICPAHPEGSVLNAVNLQFLHPNTTYCTEPMDQGIIRYVCFISFLFYQQSQSNRNRMLKFCCRRSSLFKKFFDCKDRSVKHGRKSWALWSKTFFILLNATGNYHRIWDRISN